MSIVDKSEEYVVMESMQKGDEKFIIKQEDGGGGGHHNSSTMIDNDKKMRRQIANSNERRRMQSINAGFQSLRLLLPHHEGEKLSKAAILQQTAEFVYNLEQDKNRLMSNVSYLRELLIKNNINPDLPTVNVSTTASATTSTVSGKKRKLDNVMTMQTISDSSDEGLGSMSPEPLTFVTVMTKPSGAITTTTSSSAATTNSILAKEVVELKHQLELERRQKIMLEDQLRQVECHVYPEHRLSRDERMYHHQEVIEHTDNLRVEDGVDMVDGIEDGVEVIEEDDEDDSTTISILPEDASMTKVSLSQLSDLQHSQDVQVLSLESLPPTGQNVVVCSSSPVHEISIEEAHGLSPSRVVVECTTKDDKVEICTKQQRLQPILEAVIKAEPKVEVERISNSPVSLTVVKTEDSSASAAQSRMYLTSTSRQNLETIVEAIRHLEGDHLFGETTQEQPTQEAPLALTTHNKHVQSRKIHVDVNPFLHFRAPTGTTAQHLQQQCRPGVIVVKQNS